MKLLADKGIRGLFGRIAVSTAVFALAAGAAAYFYPGAGAVGLLCALGAGISALIFCYGYLKRQNEIMETAASQITEYIAGNRGARIACDEEGEMYRLFHEINSLAAILNAQAEREYSSRQFLKNTISDISHQLKTPLAALNIYNGLLQEEAEELPQIRELAGLSEKELDRIETMVQKLLKLAKLDAGAVVMEKKPENVAEMMKEVELHFAYRAKQEHKELTLLGGEEIYLSCDRDWMLEALDNLVKNALDHTSEGDCVEIKWHESAAMVQIQVNDDGCGIHPEDLHHIFKRFYRSRFSGDRQGAGLGLPLAKMIVEAHGGTIEVSSEPGKGATFTMNFLIPGNGPRPELL